MRRLPCLLPLLALLACGGEAMTSRAPSAPQVLTGSPELVELENASTRQELFREVSRASLSQAGKATGAVLFPIVRNGQLIAAPGFEARADLLQSPDAGEGLQLAFEGQAADWSVDRRESLQGLSEREAAELVARTLLARWNLHPTGAVQVARAPGAPYAAAYMDGILRVNPAFLYLATAAVGTSSTPTVQ